MEYNLIQELLADIFADKETDGVTFFPGDKNDEINIKALEYNKPRCKRFKGKLGYIFNILVCKFSEENELIYHSKFEAVLIDPSVYISNIIQNGFYGMVIKKTTFSNKTINEVYGKLLYEYGQTT